jgi:hypothetical protein
MVDYGNGVTFTGSAGGTYGNAVLVKYDPRGNALWAKGVVSGSNSSEFISIALDASGNVYVAGNRSGNSVQFNFGLLANVTTKATTMTGIILKYAPDGTPLLQKTPESATSSYAIFYDMGIDSQGSVYVTGMKYGTVDYGNGAVTTNTGTDTIVLVKYNAALTAQWARCPASASGTNGAVYMAVDESDNIYAVGYHNGSSIAFGALPAITTSGYNGIIIKWDRDGNALWVKKGSGGSQASFQTVRAYGGHVYVAGTQNGTGSYDYGGGVTLTGTAPGTNPVLVKFDAAGGTALWAKTGAGGVAGGFERLAAGADGVYVTGYQTGTGAATYGGITLTGSSAGRNALFLRYGSDGTALSGYTAGVGTSDSEFLGVAPRDDSVYIAGRQKGTGAYTYADGGITLTGLSTDVNAVIMRHGK